MTNGSSQGLFVIVAVIIFGIFCIIAYSLFGDKMKTALGDIFGDSLEQVQKDVNDEKAIKDGNNENTIKDNNDKTINVNADDEVGDYLYFKIRNSGKDEKGVAYTEVWVKGKKNTSDGTLTIVRGEKDKTTVSNNNTRATYGYYIGGSITIPDTVTGKDGTVYKITTIGGRSFEYSKFTGTFKAPNVTEIGYDAFENSNFTGEFNAPNVTTIVEGAFHFSRFTGEFNAPNVSTIGDYAFKYSTFTGNFNAPKVSTIGNRAFTSSTFKGEFNAPNLTEINYDAFANSKFTTVNAEKLTKANVGNNNGNISDLLTE